MKKASSSSQGLADETSQAQFVTPPPQRLGQGMAS